MQKYIEDAIVAGTAVALRTNDQQDLINAAFDQGFTVYCPIEPGRVKFDWVSSSAKTANAKVVRNLTALVRSPKK